MPHRPAGEPAAIAGGSRSLAGAAAALRDVRGRLRGTTSFVVVAGAWRGPASEAFLLDGAGTQTALDRAAQGLDQAAAALAELAARLDHAQATWDRAHRLAASVGVDLSRHVGGVVPPVLRSERNPRGGVLSPADAVDPAAMLVAGQAIRMAVAAEQEVTAARRVAAARLDQAASRVPASASSHGGVAGAAGSRGQGDHAGHLRPGPGRGRVRTVTVRSDTGDRCSGWWAGRWRRGPRWPRRPITWSPPPRRGCRRRAGSP
jgi:uncharacterized protein YukE